MLQLCNAVNFYDTGKKRPRTLFPSQSDVQEKIRNLVIQNKLPGIGRRLAVEDRIPVPGHILKRSTGTGAPTTQQNCCRGTHSTKEDVERQSQKVEASFLTENVTCSRAVQSGTPTWSVNACHPRTRFESMIDWSVPATDLGFHLPPLSPGSLTYQLARRDFRRCSLDCGSRSCDAKKRKVFGKSKKCTCDARTASRVRLARYAPASDCKGRPIFMACRNYLSPLIGRYSSKSMYIHKVKN